MSKRAGAVPDKTREGLLSAAAEEFSIRGFQGSSLRRICSAAGVTTGALYFFFQGKDDLFKNLISQATAPFLELVEEHYASERGPVPKSGHQGEDDDREVTGRIIELYCDNKRLWDIILNNQDHPAVKEFFDAFIDSSTRHYLSLLSSRGESCPDAFAVHQFVHMQTDAMLTLLSHGFSREELMLHAGPLIRMLRGAFTALTEN